MSGSSRGDLPTDASTEPPPRRRFFQWISGLGAAAIALMVGTPAAAAFLSPAFKPPTEKKWLKIIDDINTVDVAVPVNVNFVEEITDAWVTSRVQRSVWLYTEDGETFSAFSTVCTHLGCGVNHDAEKDRFFCPCHNGMFETKTGAVISGPPPRGLDPIEVKVEDGELYVLYKSYRSGVEERIEA